MPSLGAGGSLVVASLCCLLLATAVITFRDWPGLGGASPGGTLTMPAPAAKAAGRAASGPSAPTPAVAAGVAADAPASAVAGERRTAARPGRPGTTRRGGTALPAPSSPNAPAAPAPVAVNTAPAAPAPAPSGSQPSGSQPTAPAADPRPPLTLPEPVPVPDVATPRVEGVVETVRPVVEDRLPPAIRQPVAPVLDTVEHVGHTVDETVGSLLPKLP